MKSSALGIIVIIIGALLVFVEGLPFGFLVFSVAWSLALLLEDDILKATEITGWTMGAGFLLWCVVWFYNGPQDLGPNLLALKWGFAGSVSSSAAGGICTYYSKRRKIIQKDEFFGSR